MIRCNNRYLILILIIPIHSSVLWSLIMGESASSHMLPLSGDYPVKVDSKELEERLTPEQFSITQNRGTERAFTGIYWDNHKDGVYRCVVCNQELFSSSTKYESGSGWPSFYDIIEYGAVKEKHDTSYGMRRTEIVCAKCGAHLGHLFNDGPKPTGKRYCINSGSLQFQEEQKEEKVPVVTKEDL